MLKSGLLAQPIGEAHQRAVQEWEEAWANYMTKLRRMDELKAAGRYGYQLRMPGAAIAKAKQKLIDLDPDFCKNIGIF